MLEQSIPPEELAAIEAWKGTIPYPVMICGVSRKANIGGFENIDAFNAISLPILSLPQVDMDKFLEDAKEIAALGFQIASRETGDRYHVIKELQEGK